MADFVIQTPDEYKGILTVAKEDGLMPVFAKAALEGEAIKQFPEKAKILVKAGIHIIEGTCRASNYRDAIDSLVAAREHIAELIPAMGTQSNIISIHRAVDRGVPVIVAADSMPLLSGSFVLPSKQKDDAKQYCDFVTQNIDKFIEALEIKGKEADLFKKMYEANPLAIDPITYCIARNVVIFPAWSDRDGLANILNRGARTGKAFNYSLRTPVEWDSLIAAVSDDYDGEILGFMGTGGLSITEIKIGPKKGGILSDKQIKQMGTNLCLRIYDDRLYADTVTPCLNTKHFIAAGASDLAEGTIDQIADKAAVYVSIVLEYRHAA